MNDTTFKFDLANIVIVLQLQKWAARLLYGPLRKAGLARVFIR